MNTPLSILYPLNTVRLIVHILHFNHPWQSYHIWHLCKLSMLRIHQDLQSVSAKKNKKRNSCKIQKQILLKPANIVHIYLQHWLWLSKVNKPSIKWLISMAKILKSNKHFPHRAAYKEVYQLLGEVLVQAGINRQALILLVDIPEMLASVTRPVYLANNSSMIYTAKLLTVVRRGSVDVPTQYRHASDPHRRSKKHELRLTQYR